MNIYDPYPQEVECGGWVYRLNLAYDRVLRAIDAQEIDELTDEDRLALQCELLLADGEKVPDSAEEQAALVAAVFSLFPKKKKTAHSERVLDLHQDAAMIRSAFFRMGIDLTRQKIHFFQFLELLADIPQDTALARVIDIRQRPLPKPTKYNGEEIARLQKAKADVALEISDEERRDQFMNSLKRLNLWG